MPLIVKNAEISVKNEVGCHQFDVCLNETRPQTIFLYEVYSDKGSFDKHIESAHFKEFDAATLSMIESKQVQTFTRINS
jgi:quinol monooxygenase YgiN